MKRNHLLGLLVAAFSVVPISAALAQASSGNIAGEAKAGDTIDVRGSDNGFHREIKIAKDGKYQIRRVPAGQYDIEKTHADGTASATITLTVGVGVTAKAPSGEP